MKITVFKVVTKLVGVNITMMHPGSNQEVATFHGSDEDERKVVIHLGECKELRSNKLKRIPFGDF